MMAIHQQNTPKARLSRAKRDAKCLELTLAGQSQHTVAADLGVSQPTVSRMLKRAEQRYLDEHAGKVDQLKARQTLALNHIHREAMRAWERSKLDVETRKTSKGTDAKGTHEKTEETRRGQSGDPRYLDQARGCLDDVRKLWGCNTPNGTKPQDNRIVIQVNYVDDFFGKRPPVVIDTATPLPAEATE